jgi:hypothetical protein
METADPWNLFRRELTGQRFVQPGVVTLLKEALMHADFDKPARLQYWSVGREADERDAIDFDTLDDAVSFAMTQKPGNKHVAWVRTASGETLTPDKLAALWELNRMRQ